MQTYRLNIGGPLFREQRLAVLGQLTAYQGTEEGEVWEGLMNLLDALADQAHDNYGIACMINLVECGICGAEHPEGFDGDCRDNANRFPKNHWEDHPKYPFSDWQYEVANNDTRLGYAEWCAHREEMDNE